MRKKADALRQQQREAEEIRQQDINAVDYALRQTFSYLSDLLKQLEVIRPTSSAAYALPRIGDMRELKFSESFIDYRRKRMGDREVFDYVTFFVKWAGERDLVVVRDMPPEIEKVRNQLYDCNLKFDLNEERDERHALVKATFTIPCQIRTDVWIRGLHAEAKVRIEARNLQRFEVDEFLIPAQDVNEATLEEFARTLLGERSSLGRYR